MPSPSINPILIEIKNLVPPLLQNLESRHAVLLVSQNRLIARRDRVKPLLLHDIIVPAWLERGRLLVIRVRADELALLIGRLLAREGDGVVPVDIHADGAPGAGVARGRVPVGPVRGGEGKPAGGLFAGLALAVMVNQIQCVHAVACPEPARDFACLVVGVVTQVHVFGAGVFAHADHGGVAVVDGFVLEVVEPEAGEPLHDH